MGRGFKQDGNKRFSSETSFKKQRSRALMAKGVGMSEGARDNFTRPLYGKKVSKDES